ncbi:hypothetical protein P3S67_003244 [Capsicum chacoense]
MRKKTIKSVTFSLFEYLNKPCFLKPSHLESANDLVCLWNDDGDVTICNPFTRQHVFLPRPIEKVDCIRINCCSFGCDLTIGKHKVVCAKEAYGEILHWSIFALGIGKSWREIHCYVRFYPMMSNCVHIDGNEDNNIAAFNVGEENVREENIRMISFPPGVELNLIISLSPTIVDIKGEVSLLEHKNFRNDGNIIVYVLTNGTIWKKKQIIELPSKFYNIKEKFRLYQFTSTPKGEIVLVPSFKISSSCWDYSFLFFYDTGKKEWTQFELCGVFQRKWGIWHNIMETMWSLE